MRIIGGRFKGRRLKVPVRFKGRPTTDFAKEALFNILVNRYDLAGISVLDLFAGTGALGYEFASRGAARITAVERDPVANRFIRDTFTELGVPALVLREDVYKFLSSVKGEFDMVVADPPYDDVDLAKIPAKVKASGCLKPGGLHILEHGAEYDFTDQEGYTETRKYGAVNFSFFTFGG